MKGEDRRFLAGPVLAGFVLAFLLVAGQGALAGAAGPREEFEGQVVGIADGDTITVRHGQTTERVRLYGVDCPERSQAFGQAARKFTSKAVFRQTVRVTVEDVDRYGRSVGLVEYGSGRLLNLELVQAGLAWVYVHYCRLPLCEEFKAEEAQARAARRGLWADPAPVPPWEFRRKERQEAGTANTPSKVLRHLWRVLSRR